MRKRICRYPKAAGTAVGVLSLVLATALGYLFRRVGFSETNIVLLYILSVLITATLADGYVYGILTSVGATLAYNYFFTDPCYSLDVDNPGYIVTFVIMTIVSLVTGTLTSRMRQITYDARRREEETLELYRLTSRLVTVDEIQGIGSAVAESVSRFLLCHGACVCFDGDGIPMECFMQQIEEGRQIRRVLEDREAYVRRIGTLGGKWGIVDEFCEYPVRGEKGIVGVIRIPRQEGAGFQEGQLRFLDSVAKCMALAISRIYSLQNQMKSQQEMTQERYRGNLLRAISHDLRTPLSGIMGTSEMIMKMSEEEDPRYQMAEGIWKDAGWLHSLVENILSLTRLQSSPVVLKKEEELVEEIVGGALEQLRRREPEREIEVDVPEEMLLVPMDGRLIMQTLVNLLDNAVKHTPPEKEVRITVEKDREQDSVVFKVSDRGEGIAPEDLPKIFETFYTSGLKAADARKGIGLGLAICKSIVQAHGGRIIARNRNDGPGAEFIFSLPVDCANTEGEEY
ncbi:MAG: DUF4118 domain-containing protein [Eubacteriales bacterium]|nr:DUF4118 domain-containing protein [Eubacteriales bacterium]